MANSSSRLLRFFRSTFRDWCGEEVEDVPEELAELALAHAVGSTPRRSYRRGDAFKKRVALMEDWATFVVGKVRCKSFGVGVWGVTQKPE